MIDVLFDTMLDAVKLLPFLFITYAAMEYIEHKMGETTKNAIEKSGRFGPVLGGIMGVFPQCGFSAAASNLYAGRIITFGTLMAVFLSTSDEMLPILLSEQAGITVIIKLLSLKVLIGIAAGFMIDFFMKKKSTDTALPAVDSGQHINVGRVCQQEHCHCQDGILKSAFTHTLNIFLFIVIISMVLNTAIHFLGKNFLAELILNKPVLGQLFAGLAGLIPNCASSVIITQLYLEGLMGLGAMMSGLLVGTGVGLLVLFRVNDNFKENIKITFLLYAVGVAAGILIEFFSSTFNI